MTINQLAQASVPIYNAQVPAEGPKAIPFTFVFDVSGIATLDLSYLTDQGRISMVQTVYLDLSSANNPVSLTHDSIQIPITVKSHTQGYYPFVCPNPIKITFAGQQNDIVKVILINTPVAPGQWATQ